MKLWKSIPLASVFLAACVDPGATEPLPEADYVLFAESVQPVLANRCANPACHGTPLRRLEVYALHRHRLDPGNVFLDAPLTDDELWLGYQHARGFLLDIDSPDACLLLRKPLAGGAEHAGGAVFEDDRDFEYQLLRRWIELGMAEVSDE